MKAEPTHNNDIDNHIDDKICSCLNLDTPKSFFLFAGAGSGKTRSLVEVLRKVRDKDGLRLRRNRQRIAVITYTNAACDEISERLEDDSLFHVVTIHSFAWELIREHQRSIKEWLRINLNNEIDDLEKKQAKGRSGTKAAYDRERKITSKGLRLERLDSVRKFSYNPNGDNRERDSLNHAEVISICASFLTNKPLLKNILVGKFPILLIDESQDTNKKLMNSFFEVQSSESKRFSLGLFGDMMQRIYGDGKEDLGENLPLDWEKPVKKMNHRCPKRIIKLINRIRSEVDNHSQIARHEKEEGVVRFFVVPQDYRDKQKIESNIQQRMAEITNDSLWLDDIDVKTLTLEHHMAASRMGFSGIFNPLYKVDRLKTGLVDGRNSGLQFFIDKILPLVEAKRINDNFAIASVIRKYSPLFEKDNLKHSSNQIEAVRTTKKSVDDLLKLWDDGNDPDLLSILLKVINSNLFDIPENLRIAASTSKEEIENTEEEEDNEEVNPWYEVLSCSFSEIEAYCNYITEKSRYSTHQGVKGLQFPRVMVIIDDNEARGFLFSYQKLFGVKGLSKTDEKNMSEGKETGVDRTRRLFYVLCSRAIKSLAIVVYSENPEQLKKHVIDKEWFDKEEIEIPV